MEIIQKCIITFTHICVKLDLSCGIPNKILVTWNDTILSQHIDYENKAFHCIFFQRASQLKGSCPSLQSHSPPSSMRNQSQGWKDSKAKKTIILFNMEKNNLINLIQQNQLLQISFHKLLKLHLLLWFSLLRTLILRRMQNIWLDFQLLLQVVINFFMSKKTQTMIKNHVYILII